MPQTKAGLLFCGQASILVKSLQKTEVGGACRVCLAGPRAVNLKVLLFSHIIARLICDWTVEAGKREAVLITTQRGACS